MQEVGPSLKVTPVFSQHTYSVYPSGSKGYYNGLFERNGKSQSTVKTVALRIPNVNKNHHLASVLEKRSKTKSGIVSNGLISGQT